MSKLHCYIIVALALAFGTPSRAHASPVTDTTFTFTGQCAPDDCSGTGTGTLVLSDYTQGSSFGEDNFVSFTYSSNLLNISFTGTGVGPGLANLVEGDMTNLPGPAFFEISGDEEEFTSSAAGTGAWCAGDDCLEDNGAISSWSVGATPLPATLPLFATGIGALGLLGSRRKRKSAALAAV
jgi:hypothetical protein